LSGSLLILKSFAPPLLASWKDSDVAKALGILKPPKWDGKVFDHVGEITFPKGKASLQGSSAAIAVW
jgi:hypothetical protein